MGRRRDRTKKLPQHIDGTKLPKNCYWDSRGAGRWYTTYKVDGKLRTVGIGDAKSKLSDLHKAIEQRSGVDVDNLNWLWGRFEVSPQYKELSKKSRDDWAYCAGVLKRTPSKVPGITAGTVPLNAWKPGAIQKLIDQISQANGPSAAAHVARYLRRLFNWSVLRELVGVSPMPQKLEMPKERQRRRLPSQELVARLVTFGQERSKIPAHQKGSCPGYVWKALVLGYRLRLRGVEVLSLTDASLHDEGIHCDRRKGSNANLVRWTQELREVVKSAQEERRAILRRRGRAENIRPERRPLLVGEDGDEVAGSTWQSAWKRFQRQAIVAGVMKEEERFGLHDMKRRGATDTKGTKAQKMDATGHKTRSELDKYDMSVPVVDAAGE